MKDNKVIFLKKSRFTNNYVFIKLIVHLFILTFKSKALENLGNSQFTQTTD